MINRFNLFMIFYYIFILQISVYFMETIGCFIVCFNNYTTCKLSRFILLLDVVFLSSKCLYT